VRVCRRRRGVYGPQGGPARCLAAPAAHAGHY
jgi:hypothetical protein